LKWWKQGRGQKMSLSIKQVQNKVKMRSWSQRVNTKRLPFSVRPSFCLFSFESDKKSSLREWLLEL
jgi:hypothetical protein